MPTTSPTSTDKRTLPVGYKLHWYLIKDVLGQGGFGITYLAEDMNLKKDVAIKEFLPREIATRSDDLTVRSLHEGVTERLQWGLERFVQEGRTLSRFDHPNIVKVHSVFEANNTAYMVMSYEQGITFMERLKSDEHLTEEELMTLIMNILDGLEEMHGEGFIHRDIKPGNIFIRKDKTPLLLDFGSARQAMSDETMTLTMMVTPGYAPVEQYYGKSDVQGPWTDIYSLGATIFRAITGDPPVDSTFRNRLSRDQAIEEMWQTLVKYSDRYSLVFLRAIEHSLRQNYKDRPQSVEEWRLMFTDPSVSTDTQWRLNDQSKEGRIAALHRFGRNWVKPVLYAVLIGAAIAVGALWYLNHMG